MSRRTALCSSVRFRFRLAALIAGFSKSRSKRLTLKPLPHHPSSQRNRSRSTTISNAQTFPRPSTLPPPPQPDVAEGRFPNASPASTAARPPPHLRSLAAPPRWPTSPPPSPPSDAAPTSRCAPSPTPKVLSACCTASASFKTTCTRARRRSQSGLRWARARRTRAVFQVMGMNLAHNAPARNRGDRRRATDHPLRAPIGRLRIGPLLPWPPTQSRGPASACANRGTLHHRWPVSHSPHQPPSYPPTPHHAHHPSPTTAHRRQPPAHSRHLPGRLRGSRKPPLGRGRLLHDLRVRRRRMSRRYYAHRQAQVPPSPCRADGTPPAAFPSEDEEARQLDLRVVFGVGGSRTRSRTAVQVIVEPSYEVMPRHLSLLDVDESHGSFWQLDAPTATYDISSFHRSSKTRSAPHARAAP